MNRIIDRARGLAINTEEAAFTITGGQLVTAIADEVDFETVTNHELKEIIHIVRKQLAHLNWKELVAYAVSHLPFGLNQTSIAFEGNCPCVDCPDAMIENSRCYHAPECKAWEIYEAHL